MILSTNAPPPLLEYLQITTGGHRTPGGVAGNRDNNQSSSLRRGACRRQSRWEPALQQRFYPPAAPVAMGTRSAEPSAPTAASSTNVATPMQESLQLRSDASAPGSPGACPGNGWHRDPAVWHTAAPAPSIFCPTDVKSPAISRALYVSLRTARYQTRRMGPGYCATRSSAVSSRSPSASAWAIRILSKGSLWIDGK